jgi:hypothetical protein
MKLFSTLAKQKRQTFLKEVLLKQTPTDAWLPIPVTEQEAEAQKNENTMKKNQLIAIINSLFVSLPELNNPKYRSLNNKTKPELLVILQEVRDLSNEEVVLEELADK